ncbi:pyridoxal-phosphate dependent enzyme [Desulfosporosinus sp. FKA]|uniref:pyridoxal-phosphate dependent enzyme n=1 Tax=Desulfosporosinus sp. FKA TaxID=1969834 RepID=UPI001FA8633E|nr:pyridoxal-phosphate dependent enzyme [Desulfosporosinus sp. FKA]
MPNIGESTYSGLLLGLHGNNYQIPVTGISVLNPKDVLKNMISELTEQTADYKGIDIQVSREDIVCFDEYIIGPGYTRPTAEMIEAVKLLAKTEGVLLDPTYTGKAMAGLIDLAKQGYFRKRPSPNRKVGDASHKCWVDN